MTEAWAPTDPLMLIGVPNTDIVTFHWALETRGMWMPEGTIMRGWSGMPIDVCRNIFVKNARQMKAKYLLFLDSDVIAMRYDWIKLLMETQAPIVSGLYWSKKSNPGMWIKNKGDPPDKQTYSPIMNFSKGSLIDVDAVGAGALLIEMRVFDEIDKICGPLHYPNHPDLSRYFYWGWPDPDNNLPGEMSEDFYFCNLAQKAGFSILCHTGAELFHEQTIAWNNEGQVARTHS